MVKKNLFVCSFIFIFSLFSCSNLIMNGGNNSIAFQMGRAAGDGISNALIRSGVDQSSELLVECKLLRGDVVIASQSKIVILSDLYATSFKLEQISNGNNYFISLGIFINNSLIYKAKSDLIILDSENNEVSVSLNLEQHNSSINYEMNGGSFQHETIVPKSYFINSNVKLPVPIKSNADFAGWYYNKDLSGDTVSELGTMNFQGDVTLYAKWIDHLSAVSFSPESSDIDYRDSIVLAAAEGAVIYYTTDGSEPSEKSNVYSKPIVFDDTILNGGDRITVKAISVKEEFISSDVVSKDFYMKKYSVTFEKNGFGVESVSNKSGLRKGSSVTLPVLTENKVTFNGWLVNGVLMPGGSSITVTDDIVVNASWYGVADPVKFSPMPSSPGSEIDFNEKVTLSCDTPGVTIYYTIDGSEPSVSNFAGKGPGDVVINKREGMTIKAFAAKKGLESSSTTSVSYNIKEYTIEFNHMNRGNLMPANVKLAKTEKVADPGVPDELGYTFGGWYTSMQFSGNPWDFDNDTVTSDMCLYAKWDVNHYTVRFNANDSGAIGSMDDKVFTYNVPANLTTCGFSKSGFEFGGWYRRADSSGSADFSDGASVEKLSEVDGEIVNLYAKWNDVEPQGVIPAVNHETGTLNVRITWTNPDVEDFGRVDITYKDYERDGTLTEKTLSVPSSEVGRGASGEKIIAVSNGASVVFSMQAFDRGGNASVKNSAGEVVVNPYGLTVTPVDKGGNIFEFGDWPQTVKAGNVNIPDSNTTVNINGWDCYKGSDNKYYVKASGVIFQSPGDINLTDGSKVASGTEYYFKLEPIRWNVLTDNYNGKRLLLSEKNLCSGPYYSGSGERGIPGIAKYDNDYEASEIRAFLNGGSYNTSLSQVVEKYNGNGFLQKAFTPKGISAIGITNVDNGAASTGTVSKDVTEVTDVCPDTQDRIFLLSVNEISRTEYGFSDKKTNDPTRVRKGTDYMMATGAQLNGGVPNWWLRSANAGSDKQVKIINKDGQIDNNGVNVSGGGIVPALTLK